MEVIILKKLPALLVAERIIKSYIYQEKTWGFLGRANFSRYLYLLTTK